ncbi:G-protein coupled receptor [Xylogone sp. PMI_703]|nr:G-protein coupled receptor [Xylogone sp. PMI_703]
MRDGQLELSELNAMSTIERVCSALSLLGCCFIIVTFLSFRAFHKPINRLVFYASAGNVLTNVATLVARAALDHESGFLCQFQSFLIQMFMPADAYWTFAMAMNVYLTFYWKYDAHKLRSLEIPYIICCYGIPFVPAFVYIWIKTRAKGRFYGNATLWCWVADNWDVWRILTFYGPVWVVILLTILIYVRTGSEIYKRRRQLQTFSSGPPDVSLATQIQDPFTSMKTTEITVTTEQIDSDSSDTIDLQKLGRSTTRAYPGRSNLEPKGNNNYSVSISTSPQQAGEKTEVMSPTIGDVSTPITPGIPNTELPTRTPRSNAIDINRAAWSYTKVAMLFFVAMMVTWIPSSANRVYSVMHPGQVSLPLLYMSAFVLPLQGFWNAVIYISTSLPACKAAWRQLVGGHKRSSSRHPRTPIGDVFGDTKGQRLQSRRGRQSLESSESMTELATHPSTANPTQ